ncbi:MAG: NAD(P)/FAD-dependent oxidoreductase [Phycisphaeraceae bacterium]
MSGAYFKPTQRKDLWVGTPGMNALSSAMLDSLHVRFESQVRTIERTADRWAVIEASGDRHAGFDQLLITVPAPQVGPILGQYFPDASDTAARATMMPCWTLMVAFKKRIDLSFDAAKVTGDGPIGWLARNSSKPGRLDNGMDCWVVQAGHGWSRDHVERSPQEAADALLSDFTRVCRESSISIAPLTHLAVHRWRYALAMPGDTPHFMIHADTGLAVAGDWLAGGRIEKAWLSGLAAAEALTLNRLEKKPTIVGASHK